MKFKYYRQTKPCKQYKQNKDKPMKKPNSESNAELTSELIKIFEVDRIMYIGRQSEFLKYIKAHSIQSPTYTDTTIGYCGGVLLGDSVKKLNTHTPVITDCGEVQNCNIIQKFSFYTIRRQTALKIHVEGLEGLNNSATSSSYIMHYWFFGTFEEMQAVSKIYRKYEDVIEVGINKIEKLNCLKLVIGESIYAN